MSSLLFGMNGAISQEKADLTSSHKRIHKKPGKSWLFFIGSAMLSLLENSEPGNQFPLCFEYHAGWHYSPHRRKRIDNAFARSEERRVGKEWRGRWAAGRGSNNRPCARAGDGALR